MKVFVLMEEDYGGMFTSPSIPVGKAFVDEQDAKQWVSEQKICPRSYIEVEIL